MQRRINPISLIFLVLLVVVVMRSQLASGLNLGDWLLEKLFLAPGIIIGLALHEFGHAIVADKLGDSTPRIQGRVTVNPAAHIDVVGLIALFLVGFGWGKPVEIDERNFRKRRRDSLLVSIAGVVMNLLVAIVGVAILKVMFTMLGYASSGTSVLYMVERMILMTVYINLVLMVFNLLPIPPLDGFNLITEIFNLKKYGWWYQVYNKGFLILLLCILLNVTDMILSPCLTGLMSIVYTVLI